MVKRLAALLVGLIVVFAIASPTYALGIQEQRQRNKDRAKAEGQLGDDALQDKKYDEAIDHYTKVIEANACQGPCGKYYFRRGLAWQGKQDCTKALEDYTKAEETLTDNGELFFNASLCHTQAKQDDLALADLDKAIKVNPESTNYHYARCIILFNKHQFAQALPDCEVTLGPAPDDKIMLYATATSAEQTGDKAKAAKYFKHLLELDPSNQDAKNGVARTGS